MIKSLNNLQKLEIPQFFYLLLIFIPISIVLSFIKVNPVILFIVSLLSLIPLAMIMGYTTQQISLQSNPTVGGLVSATFGNIIELFIAILALRQGLIEVVKGSIIGSIVGNILLLIGLSIMVGGFKYKHQRFNKEAIGVSSTMLIIVVVGIVTPSLYSFINHEGIKTQIFSEVVAGIMALTYIANLIFSLKTHKDLFDASDEIKATHHKPVFSLKFAALVLCLTTIVAAMESEFLVGTIKSAALSFGITETFIGVVLIAIITNVAEKSTAISLALNNHLDISLEIGLSSAIQIALFVVPILVLISHIFHFGFTLSFSIFEIISVILAVTIINHLAADGRCNWLEGAQLISVYLIIAIAFFFI